jgi:hypothetical protein
MKNKFVYVCFLLSYSFSVSFSSQEQQKQEKFERDPLDKGRKWKILKSDVISIQDQFAQDQSAITTIAKIDRSTKVRVEKDNQSLHIFHENGVIAYCNKKNEHQEKTVSK